MKTLILKCRFCSTITGEYNYPDNLSVADLGIADTRCDQHETEFGNYKEMAQEYELYGKTYDEFKVAIASSDYKKSNFDKEIAKIKPISVSMEPDLGAVKLRKTPKYGKIKSNKK